MLKILEIDRPNGGICRLSAIVRTDFRHVIQHLDSREEEKAIRRNGINTEVAWGEHSRLNSREYVVVRKSRTHQVLIIIVVLLAVVGHEMVDLFISPWRAFLLLRVIALGGVALISVAFGLYLLNVYAIECEALNRSSKDNVALQLALSKTVAHLKDCLEIANQRNYQMNVSAELTQSLHCCGDESELHQRISSGLPQVLPNWCGCLYLGRKDGLLRKRATWPKGITFLNEMSPRRCPAFQECQPQTNGSLHCSSCADQTRRAEKPLVSPRLRAISTKYAPCIPSRQTLPASIARVFLRIIVGVIWMVLRLGQKPRYE